MCVRTSNNVSKPSPLTSSNVAIIKASESCGQRQPTKRAVDLWDSAAFSSIFLASGFSCSQAFSQPAHKPLREQERINYPNVCAGWLTKVIFLAKSHKQP